MPGIDRYTMLMLHFDGTDASTTFTDSSFSPHTVTVSGNAQLDTAQFKFGTASGLFDGSGDFLNLDGSSDFAFGTGDFTVDLWVRFSSVALNDIIYDSRPGGTSGLYPTLLVGTGNVFSYFCNSATRITGSTVIANNTWYHVALSRSGTSTKLFVNGSQEGGTYADTDNLLNGGARPTIAVSGFNTAVGDLAGWIDELRVSKGTARFTSNFSVAQQAYDSALGFNNSDSSEERKLFLNTDVGGY